MIVVDVNVIAYLLIAGEYTASCERVLERDVEWAAPLLWRSEWRNMLAGYLRRGGLDRPGVAAHLNAADALVHGREYVVDGEAVLDLVAVSSCSAYDCEYVALADALDVPLVTADQRILSDFPRRAISPEGFATS